MAGSVLQLAEDAVKRGAAVAITLEHAGEQTDVRELVYQMAGAWRRSS